MIARPGRVTFAVSAISEYLKNPNDFIGETGEVGLDHQVKRSGNNNFPSASDFPHEIGPQDILHEIEEVQNTKGLCDEEKAAILGGNELPFIKRLKCDKY